MSDTDTIRSDDTESESAVDRLRRHVSENRGGMFYDLVFALAWVTSVSLLYNGLFTGAPQWVLYMFMLAGVPAYYGFVLSLSMAKEQG
jgi:hypothetical protein